MMRRISLAITAVLLMSLSIISSSIQVKGQSECSTLGGPIGSLAFSPDGKYLLLGKGDIAELWSIRDQKYLRSFVGHGQQLGPFSLAVAFSPDGNHVVTGGSDAMLHVWNTETGAQEYQVDFHKGEITHIAYLRNGAGLIASTFSGPMYLWTGSDLKSLPMEAYTFAVSQDEKLLFSAGFSGADLYDIEKGLLLKHFSLLDFPTQYGGAIQGLDFSPDNKTVFVSTDDSMLIDAQSGKVLRILSTERTSSAAFSPDGSLVATAQDTTKIWDVHTGTLLKTLALPDFYPYSVAFSPDGSTVAVASRYSDTGARIWNTASGQFIRKLEHPPCATPTPWLRPTLAPIDSNFWGTTGAAPTTGIAVAINRDIVALHANGSNRIQLTNYHYNDDPVLSPDRQWIAYRSLPLSIVQQGAPENSWFTDKRNIWIINAKTSQAIKLTDSELSRGAPIWSSDSTKIAFTEGEEQTHSLIETDIATKVRHVIAANVTAARYHPGGNGIAYTNDPGDLVWIDKSGTTRTIVQGKPKLQVSDVDWMPDGQHLVYVLSDSTNPDLPDTPFGIAYSMWIIGVDQSNPHKLADGLHDISVAPDGKYIAGYEGSGYTDAGHVFLSIAFLQLAPDLMTGTLTKFDQFIVPPDITQWQYNPQYPSIAWVGGHLPVASYDDGTVSLVDLEHKTFMTVSQPETYP